MTAALVLRRTVFLLLLAASLYAFLSPATPDGGPEGSDKVVHALIFATLTLTGGWAGLRPLPLAAGLAAYAVSTELLQATLPLGRHGDPLDMLADLVGVGLGLAVAAGLRRARRAAPSPVRPRG